LVVVARTEICVLPLGLRAKWRRREESKKRTRRTELSAEVAKAVVTNSVRCRQSGRPARTDDKQGERQAAKETLMAGCSTTKKF